MSHPKRDMTIAGGIVGYAALTVVGDRLSLSRDGVLLTSGSVSAMVVSDDAKVEDRMVSSSAEEEREGGAGGIKGAGRSTRSGTFSHSGGRVAGSHRLCACVLQ